MNTLVVYMSQTGNTAKVARAIFDQIPGRKEIREMDKTEKLEGYDLIFLGFPILRFGPPPEAVNFLADKAKGKSVALFVTHSAAEDMSDVKQWLDKCRQAAEGTVLRGVFNCQGELGQQIADIMLKSSNEDLVNWAKMRPATIGMPDTARIERARLWTKNILSNLD